MVNQEKMACLKTSFLFQHLNDEDLRDVVQMAKLLEYDKGSFLFQEGENAHGLYIICQGQVRVYKVSPEGKEYVLHIFEKGEPVGEVAVFTGSTFPASAITLAQTWALYINRERFLALITNRPQLALSMLATLSQRLRSFTKNIEDLAFKEVGSRVARYLWDMGENGQVKLRITKGELAKLLGTSPETLSRTLSRLSELGIIQVSGRKIMILESSLLEDIAQGAKI